MHMKRVCQNRSKSVISEATLHTGTSRKVNRCVTERDNRKLIWSYRAMWKQCENLWLYLIVFANFLKNACLLVSYMQWLSKLLPVTLLWQLCQVSDDSTCIWFSTIYFVLSLLTQHYYLSKLQQHSARTGIRVWLVGKSHQLLSGSDISARAHWTWAYIHTHRHTLLLAHLCI